MHNNSNNKIISIIIIIIKITIIIIIIKIIIIIIILIIIMGGLNFFPRRGPELRRNYFLGPLRPPLNCHDIGLDGLLPF